LVEILFCNGFETSFYVGGQCGVLDGQSIERLGCKSPRGELKEILLYLQPLNTRV